MPACLPVFAKTSADDVLQLLTINKRFFFLNWTVQVQAGIACTCAPRRGLLIIQEQRDGAEVRLQRTV